MHNQGAALLNQGHPAVRVIEAYLQTMKSQWEWLLNLARCYEVHLTVRPSTPPQFHHSSN